MKRIPRRAAFLLALAPQLLLLAAMIARAEWALTQGARVELEVLAYDPMDPLSGRFVVNRLAVHRVDPALLEVPAENVEVGRPLYVRLAAEPKPAQPIGLTVIEPGPGSGPYLRGTVREIGARIEVDYGLERTFIPLSGTDPTTYSDEQGRRPELRLAVRLKDGVAIIETLLVDGVPYGEWNAALAARPK